jgi:hypothetical protein
MMARVDHQFSGGPSIFARYTFDDGEVDDPSRLNTGGLTKTRVQFLTVEHTALRGASFMNRLQFGYSRSRLDGIGYALEGSNLPQTTFTDVTRGIGAISVTGLSGWGGETTNPKFHRFTNYQISHNINLTKGAHNVRLGAHVEFLAFDLTYDLLTVNVPIVQNTAVRVPPFINRGGLVRSSTFAIDFPNAYTTQRQALAGQVALEGVQNGTRREDAGRITSTATAARQMQLGVRLVW